MGIASERARSSLAFDDEMLRIFRPAFTFSPSSLMKCVAVEPEPRPTTMPSLTNSRLFCAATIFAASAASMGSSFVGR